MLPKPAGSRWLRGMPEQKQQSKGTRGYCNNLLCLYSPIIALAFLVAILNLLFLLNSNFIILHCTFPSLKHSLHSFYQFILISCCHDLELGHDRSLSCLLYSPPSSFYFTKCSVKHPGLKQVSTVNLLIKQHNDIDVKCAAFHCQFMVQWVENCCVMLVILVGHLCLPSVSS